MYESILISQFPKCISVLSHFIKSWNASQACLIVVFCGEHIFQTRKLILQVQRQPLYCNFLPKATRSWELEKCNVWCRWKSFNSHFMRSSEGSGPPKVTTIPYVCVHEFRCFGLHNNDLSGVASACRRWAALHLVTHVTLVIKKIQIHLKQLKVFSLPNENSVGGGEWFHWKFGIFAIQTLMTLVLSPLADQAFQHPTTFPFYILGLSGSEHFHFPFYVMFCHATGWFLG